MKNVEFRVARPIMEEIFLIALQKTQKFRLPKKEVVRSTSTSKFEISKHCLPGHLQSAAVIAYAVLLIKRWLIFQG